MSHSAHATPAEPTTLLGKFLKGCKDFVLAWWDLFKVAWPTVIAILVCVHFGDYRGVFHATWSMNWAETLFTSLWSIICHWWRTPGWWFIAACLNCAALAVWNASADHHAHAADGHGHSAKKKTWLSWLGEYEVQVKTWVKYWLPTIVTIVLLASAYAMNYLPLGFQMLRIFWFVAVSNACGIWWWIKRHSGH